MDEISHEQQIPAQQPAPQIAQHPQPQQIQQQHHPQPHAQHHAPKEPGKWKQRWLRLKEFTKECKRVLAITKKPNRDEFKTIVKISGIGIGLIGLIGFLIHFAREGLRALGI